MEQQETMMERWARENGMSWDDVKRAEDGGNIPVSPMRAEIVLRKIKSASSKTENIAILDKYFPDCDRGIAGDVKADFVSLSKGNIPELKNILDILDLWIESKEGMKREGAIKVDNFTLTGIMAHPANRIYLDVGVRYGVLEPDNYAVVIGTTKEHFFVYASVVIGGAMGYHRFKKIAGETWKECYDGDGGFLKDQRGTKIANYEKEGTKIRLIMSELGIAEKQPKKLIKL